MDKSVFCWVGPSFPPSLISDAPDFRSLGTDWDLYHCTQFPDLWTWNGTTALTFVAFLLQIPILELLSFHNQKTQAQITNHLYACLSSIYLSVYLSIHLSSVCLSFLLWISAVFLWKTPNKITLTPIKDGGVCWEGKSYRFPMWSPQRNLHGGNKWLDLCRMRETHVSGGLFSVVCFAWAPKLNLLLSYLAFYEHVKWQP